MIHLPARRAIRSKRWRSCCRAIAATASVSLELDVKKNGDTPLRVRADVAQRVRPSEKLVEEVEHFCGAGSVVLR